MKSSGNLTFNIIATIVVVGVVCSFLYIIRGLYFDIKYGNESKSWPTTQGMVLELFVKKDGGTTDSPNYYSTASYSYGVDGQAFTGDRLRFFREPVGNYLLAEELLEGVPYDVGEEVVVYYHPEDPAISTLETGSPYQLWHLIVGLAGFLTVVFMIVRYFYRVNKRLSEKFRVHKH